MITVYAGSAAATGWLNSSNAIGNTPSTKATLPVGYSGTGVLRLGGFDLSQLINPSYTVLRVVVSLGLSVSGALSPPSYLKCSLSYDGTTSKTLKKIVPYSVASDHQIDVEFSSDSDGFLLDKNSLRNSNFRVILEPHTSHGNALQIAWCKLTVYHEYQGYLRGRYSKFPKALDNLQEVENSPLPSIEDEDYIIRSLNLNTLGDAIIKIQKTMLLDKPTLSSLGPGLLQFGALNQSVAATTYAFTAQVTGNSLPAWSGRLLWSENGTEVSTASEQPGKGAGYSVVNLPGVVGSSVDLSSLDFGNSETLKFLMPIHVSGCGWVTSGGVHYPLVISAKPLIVFDWQSSPSKRIKAFSLGWSAFPANSGSYWSSVVSGQLPQHALAYGPIYGGSSTFNIRLFGLFQEVNPYAL